MKARAIDDPGLAGSQAADLSPEARRKRAQSWQEGLQDQIEVQIGAQGRFWNSRVFRIIKRVWIGAFHDGFIHAGNLAYMAILALFPFFITMGAIFSAIGEEAQREASIHAFLAAAPPMVASVIEPVARDVIAARSGWLLWAGGAVGLWTVGSLIETIRDMLRRAYGTGRALAYWRHRLISTSVIVLAVLALLFSLFAQAAISTADEVIAAWFPRLSAYSNSLAVSRLIPPVVLYCALYMLFFTLTPTAYRTRAYPKWPGALLVTLWWATVMSALPWVLARFFTYDLTYGSLAGVMIVLFFFWLVGLGMVVGAELNAALAVTPEERDMLNESSAQRISV
jgi:membrane protein